MSQLDEVDYQCIELVRSVYGGKLTRTTGLPVARALIEMVSIRWVSKIYHEIADVEFGISHNDVLGADATLSADDPEVQEARRKLEEAGIDELLDTPVSG